MNTHKNVFEKFKLFTVADIMQLQIKNIQENAHNKD